MKMKISKVIFPGEYSKFIGHFNICVNNPIVIIVPIKTINVKKMPTKEEIAMDARMRIKIIFLEMVLCGLFALKLFIVDRDKIMYISINKKIVPIV